MDTTRLIVTALLLALAPATASAAGTVLDVDGSVTIARDGQTITAAKATPLVSGDTLTVGSLGKVRVQFEDDSIFAIPGPASFRVDEFVMPKGKQGGKAIFTLQDGGLRTITGRISKRRGDTYEMRAEEATISVSGSAYSSIRCTSQCGKKYKAGLYVRGEQGLIIVTNAGGQLKLRVGKIAYVAGSASAPVIVTASPFSEPQFSGDMGLEIQVEGDPPRIEGEAPASAS